MTGAGTEMRYTYMLAFLLAVVVLLSLMFRYVTGVRLVLKSSREQRSVFIVGME